MKGNYEIQDMTCQHCVNTIDTTLKNVSGIEKINISLKDKLVQIDGEYDENEVVNSIQKSGYSIKKRRINEN